MEALVRKVQSLERAQAHPHAHGGKSLALASDHVWVDVDMTPAVAPRVDGGERRQMNARPGPRALARNATGNNSVPKKRPLGVKPPNPLCWGVAGADGRRRAGRKLDGCDQVRTRDRRVSQKHHDRQLELGRIGNSARCA